MGCLVHPLVSNKNQTRHKQEYGKQTYANPLRKCQSHIGSNQMLCDAFTELLSKKKFENIMINDLCEKALVRRATFYTHFIDKYDFFTYFIRQNRDQFISNWNTPESQQTLKDFSILMDILADEIRASSSAQGLGGNMRQVLDYVQEHGAITRPETEKLLGVSASTASRLLKEMIKNDLLIRQGKARNIKYVSAK